MQGISRGKFFNTLPEHDRPSPVYPSLQVQL